MVTAYRLRQSMRYPVFRRAEARRFHRSYFKLSHYPESRDIEIIEALPLGLG